MQTIFDIDHLGKFSPLITVSDFECGALIACLRIEDLTIAGLHYNDTINLDIDKFLASVMVHEIAGTMFTVVNTFFFSSRNRNKWYVLNSYNLTSKPNSPRACIYFQPFGGLIIAYAVICGCM
jgi:hypothetical protein